MMRWLWLAKTSCFGPPYLFRSCLIYLIWIERDWKNYKIFWFAWNLNLYGLRTKRTNPHVADKISAFSPSMAAVCTEALFRCDRWLQFQSEDLKKRTVQEALQAEVGTLTAGCRYGLPHPWTAWNYSRDIVQRSLIRRHLSSGWFVADVQTDRQTSVFSWSSCLRLTIHCFRLPHPFPHVCNRARERERQCTACLPQFSRLQ